MAPAPRKPLIGMPLARGLVEGTEIINQSIGDLYVEAVVNFTGGTVIGLPALGEAVEISAITGIIDGLMLPGGRSNIEPDHYGGPPFPADEPTDPARDTMVLPLIRACIDLGIPILGTCRGLQEINVALGGSLHYRINELPGRLDHRMRPGAPRAEIFGPRHPIGLTPGGLFAELAGAAEVITNSLHGQGIDRLAAGLDVEATAEDGTIEGIRLAGAKAFTAAGQWHLEWQPENHTLSRGLYAAFDAAIHQRAKT